MVNIVKECPLESNPDVQVQTSAGNPLIVEDRVVACIIPDAEKSMIYNERCCGAFVERIANPFCNTDAVTP